MKVMTLVRILLLFFVAGLVYICLQQGDIIMKQRVLIRQMAQNPDCIIP
jgi:hypothetical protein